VSLVEHQPLENCRSSYKAWMLSVSPNRHYKSTERNDMHLHVKSKMRQKT